MGSLRYVASHKAIEGKKTATRDVTPSVLLALVCAATTLYLGTAFRVA